MTARVGLSRTSSSPAFSDSSSKKLFAHELSKSKSRAEPLWRKHDAMAQKKGERGTISWVGKSIIGEDGAPTGQRTKGASYRGEWDNNKKSGYGVQVFPSGEKYEGQWHDGMRNGEGTHWVPVGKGQRLRKAYVGGWKDDRRHGRGTCFLKNGEFFQGYWDQGRMQGEGTLRYDNGDLFVGEFHDGKRSGRGTLTKANGDCYEGQWLDDKREGSGSFFYAGSGKVFVGEWANDLPKAGVYTQASSNPQQADSVPSTTALPPIRLAMPTDVLQGALAVVRWGRRSLRLKASPLHRLFSDEEIVSLRAAFESAQRADGTAGRLELQALCATLGAEVDVSRLRELLIAAGHLPSDCEEQAVLAASLNFDQFMRLIAVLLEDEAEAAQQPPAQEENDWDELPSKFSLRKTGSTRFL